MKLRRQKQIPSKGLSGAFLNSCGVLSALILAFVGFFLVQDGLTREQEKLLRSGGLVELPQTGTVGEEMSDASIGQLSEEELLQLVKSMEQKGEVRPHEPVQGQLTMAQAMERAMAWLEETLFPRFGLSDALGGEYKATCFLWSPEAVGQDLGAAPWLGCWMVSVSSQDVDIALKLSAVSGQILDASVSCSAPVSYEGSDIRTLLGEYADSFGLEGDDVWISGGETDAAAKKMPLYQSIGTKGIYAAIRADSMVVSTSEEGERNPLSREFFSLHLYLCSEVQVP